ncbi:MAG: hypothetical protein ABFD29_11525 [Anaerolineaceae bacterium]
MRASTCRPCRWGLLGKPTSPDIVPEEGASIDRIPAADELTLNE